MESEGEDIIPTQNSFNNIERILSKNNYFDLQSSDISDDELIPTFKTVEKYPDRFATFMADQEVTNRDRKWLILLVLILEYIVDGLHPRKQCIPYFTWLQTGGGICRAGLGHAGSDIDMCMVVPHTLFISSATHCSLDQRSVHASPWSTGTKQKL